MAEYKEKHRETIDNLRPGDYKPEGSTLDPSGGDYVLPYSLKMAQGLANLHVGGRQPSVDELVRLFMEGVPTVPGPGMMARGLGFLLGNRPRPQLYTPRKPPPKEYI